MEIVFCRYFSLVATLAMPWLVAFAVLSLLLCLGLLIWEKRPFEKEIARFASLAPTTKIVSIFMLCVFTWWGGAKEGGDRGGSSSNMRRESHTAPLRSLPPALTDTTNLLTITALEVSQTNQTLAFETVWATNLFDYTDSRNLYLFSSTNLMEHKWTPLCMIPMPADTNAYLFAVTQNDVIPSMRHWFVDSFGGVGFYRFGIDFDSDGDGIADALETLWTFTDPEKFDTDGDGLSDGLELSASVNSDPLAYDTDGDGVNDRFSRQDGMAGLLQECPYECCERV